MKNNFIVLVVSLFTICGLGLSCKSTKSKGGADTDISSISGIFTSGCKANEYDNVSQIVKQELGGSKLRTSLTMYGYTGDTVSCLDNNQIAVFTQTSSVKVAGSYKGATVLEASFVSATAKPLTELGVTILEALIGSGASLTVGSEVDLTSTIDLGTTGDGGPILVKVDGDRMYMNYNYDPELGDGNEDVTKGDIYTRAK